MKKNTTNTTKIAALVLSIVVLLVLVGGIVIYINSADIRVDGVALNSGDSVSLLDKESLNFTVNAKSYYVKIMPNPDAPDFEYTIDNNPVSFQAATEYTAGFTIEQTARGFQLSAMNGFKSILLKYYPDSSFECPSIDGSKYPYYLLEIVTDEAAYKFPLYVGMDANVLKITLDKEAISI